MLKVSASFKKEAFQQNVVNIPYSIDHYNYAAVFLGQLKNIGLGIIGRSLLNEERLKYRLKFGLYITAIVDDSPSFYSNITEGDILLRVNNKIIKNCKDLNEINLKNSKKVNIEFLRDGKLNNTIIVI